MTVDRPQAAAANTINASRPQLDSVAELEERLRRLEQIPKFVIHFNLQAYRNHDISSIHKQTDNFCKLTHLIFLLCQLVERKWAMMVDLLTDNASIQNSQILY
jgi:hypothetical protein